jgi:ubiquinone/menaquinone biosynthesis C-methylase UbiE
MKKGWNEIWGEYSDLNWFGRQLKKSQTKVLERIMGSIGFPKSSKILDVGCGTGSTLKMIRSLGYGNSVGVDFSAGSIEFCGKKFGFRKGKDVVVMDARKLKFRKGSFDMVFSDGMLEHLPNIDKAIGEMARISRKYVLLFQPNQASVLALLKDIAPKLKKVSWEKEYPYSKSDYIASMKKHGFRLMDSGSVHFMEEVWLLFVKS